MVKDLLGKPYEVVKGHTQRICKEVRNKIGAAIVAAFAFIIALVWKDTITEIVNKIVPDVKAEETTYIYVIISALITTIICVIEMMYFSKWSEKEEKNKTVAVRTLDGKVHFGMKIDNFIEKILVNIKEKKEKIEL